MNAVRATDASMVVPRGRSIATSMFGGAMLASVATASVAQTYYTNVAALTGTTVSSSYIVLGGYTDPGDGGGGTLLEGAAGCTPDGGLVFKDMAGNCFYRADPTYSVREWGAKCDVAQVNSTGTLTAVWTPGSGSAAGTLTVPTALLPAPLKNGENIAISQIGGPTLWTATSAAALPAVSLTRFSTLGGAQTAYQAGDLISFAGGTFTQQAAIVVDAVDGGGSIAHWHFLWGGLYDPATKPTTSMAQDDVRSYCGSPVIACGTTLTGVGAILTPAWSGWSVLNSQTITSPGSGYTVGDTVTLTGAGAVANQSHLPELIVESIGTSGAVTAYDWLDYGSLATLPTNPTTLTASTGSGTGLSVSPVVWTEGPFATTINTFSPSGTITSILLTDQPPVGFPTGYSLPIQSFYYGDDDSQAINNALASKPASALVIPAGCGTTRPLLLSQDASPSNANPALVGGNAQSSGIYAFAYPLTSRYPSVTIPMMTAPVLGQVLYGGLVNTSDNGFVGTTGGGFRNLFVEGFGIPQGYGYFGLTSGVTPPLGYDGPLGSPYLIPTAGSAVEIDSGSLVRIDNVHISDGGIGPGNAAFQCGLDESDPRGTISGVASIAFTNSRLDTNSTFSTGPGNPDFALRLGASCRGSVYRNLAALDGDMADALQYGGNVLSQINVDSDAANLPGSAAPTINWGTIASAHFGLAGVANYGVYVLGTTTLSQTVCGIANYDCVLTLPNATAGSGDVGHITDTQMRCAAFTSVPTGYFGVKLGRGAPAVTVSGAASAGKCAIPPTQLLYLDGSSQTTNLTSASASLCNNSNAPVAGCTGYQGPFAATQFYTQPVVSYGTISAVANRLYAVPFYSPASGGPINTLGLSVMNPGSATHHCRLAVYYAAGGIPTGLIVEGRTLSVSGTVSVTGTLSAPVQLAPQTLYFLAVKCDAAVILASANPTPTNGSLSTTLLGAVSTTSNATQINVTSAYALALPNPFTNPGTLPTIVSGSVPNVYAGP